MLRLAMGICVLAFFATACVKAPSQKGFSYSAQPKIQSAGHWAQMADCLVGNHLAPRYTTPEGKPVADRPAVFVSNADKSDFGVGFRTYLTSALIKKSFEVSEKNTPGGLVVDWSVQKVTHGSYKKNPGVPGGVIGVAGVIAYELIAGDLLGDMNDPYFGTAIPETELIITMNIKLGDKIIVRESNTFYVEGKDAHNYWSIPDDKSLMAQAYVEKGAIVCRDAVSLKQAEEYDIQGKSQLPYLVNQGQCAIMKGNIPVLVKKVESDYLVVGSKGEASSFVTKQESVSSI